MSVSTYRNKTYRIPNLQKHIYLLDASKIEDELHIDYENLSLDEIISNDILKINGTSVTLQENTSIDERYAFAKTLTISIDGYYSIENIGNRYYFVVEDYHNNQYLVNFDLPSLITYQYDVDNSVNQTTYTFQILSNFPLVRLINNISATSEQRHCRYWYGNAHKIKMIEKNYVVINKETKEIIIANNETFKEIEPLTFNLSENYNGNDFTTTVSFTIPLSEYKSYWQYSLLEFTLNRYSMIIEPFVGENDIYIGFGEFGLAPNYTISTDGDNIVTITLTTTERIYTNEPFETHQDGQLFWIPISSVTTDHDEYMTSFECSSTDGYAKYLLIKEVNAFGEPTGNYKVLEGYEEDYANFINIVGTFDNEILFPNDDCKFHCSTISSIPNLIVFSAVTSYTYTVNSLCDWNITHNLPNGVVISPLTGEAGITNVTISCNDISANEGLYTLVLHTAEEDLPTQVSVRLSQNESYYKEIDARRQNVYFVTAFDLLSIQSGDVDKIAAYEIENNIIKIVVPRNDTTESRTFELHGINMYGSLVDFYIEQYGIIQEWREEDDEYICVGGDLYTVATLWTGYTQADLRRTNEQRANTMSVPRSEECEQYYKWQWNGDTVCVEGDLYQQLTEMRSSDGYEWFETENTMQGDLIERYSLECAENVYSISAYTTDEVGSSIWTTMIVNINGSSTTYSDTSACTFSVAEGCPFEIVFADKANYSKPEPITGIAVANTSYTGVYTTQMSYSIGVKTIDENRNYIITDITACVNNNCATYSDVSGITVTAPSGSSYSLDFGTVEGYITPSGISSTTTADVNHVVVYEFEGIKYNITVNTEDNNGNPIVTNYIVCINGECNLVENVSSHTFSVKEDETYTVMFDNVSGYSTPRSITGVATSSTSYTAVYNELEVYNLTVNIIDENGNPLATEILLCIDGNCNSYSNVSSYSTTAYSNSYYSITFSSKHTYITPATITGRISGNTTLTAMYENSPLYQLAVSTIDERSNPFNTDITVCVDGNCNTYQNVSSYTFTAYSDSFYSISFADKVDYIKPPVISGYVSGDTSFTATYYDYVITYRYINDGMICGSDIFGSPLEAEVAYQEVEGYLCSGGTKYQKVEEMAVISGNAVNFIPTEYTFGYPIEVGSEDCGHVPTPATYKARFTLDNTIGGLRTSDVPLNGSSVLNRSEISSYTDNVYYDAISVEVSSAVTSLSGSGGYGTFYGFSGLTSATFTDSTTAFTSDGTFANCTNLKTVVLPNTLTSTGGWCFSQCHSLENVRIPSGLTSIGSSDFGYCYSLKSIDIPDNITSIGSYAFSNCSGLTSVTIGSGVTSIGYGTFSNCSGLTSITIPSSVTSIGNSAFTYCTSITSITIPSSVTGISEYTFWQCQNLNSIIIGSGVTSIGKMAFQGCTSLNEITSLRTTAPTLGSSAFRYVASSGTLYYPTGSNYSTWISALPSGWTAVPI